MSLSSIQALKRKNMQLFNFNIKEKKTSVITKIERGTPNEKPLIKTPGSPRGNLR